MKTELDQFRSEISRIRAADGFVETCLAAGIDNLDALSTRDIGTSVTNHRSSWVRRLEIGGIDVFIKTYDYPTGRDRRRGLGRNTAFARSRAAREATALDWLRQNGFDAPRPLLVAESRGWFFLRRAVLVTAAWPGRRLDHLLPELAAEASRELITALHSSVETLHRTGFRHRNLDLRNILARSDDHGWQLGFLDAPRFRLRRQGLIDDRLARLDRERLRRSLEAIAAGP